MKHRTYYHVLNISPRASDKEVRGAYYALARRWHPDRNPLNRRKAEARFVEIGRAYAVLKTQPQRDAYNRHLLSSLRKQGSGKASVRLPAPRLRRNNSVFMNLVEILWPFTFGVTRHG